MISLRRLARDTRGSAAVDYALMMGPFLVLMFGVFEFGRLMWTREALQETAAVGARCMGMSASSCASSGAYSSDSTTTFIDGVASNWGLTLTAANLTLNNNTTCAGVGSTKGFSSVTISYRFQSYVPGVIAALASGSSLSNTACFPNN